MNSTLLRRILSGAVLALGIAALLAVALSVVALRTTTGARWVLAIVSGSIPHGSLDVESVRGTLASPLELRGVEYRTDSLLVTARHLTLRWELAALFGRELAIHSLDADSVRVHPLVAPPPADTTHARTLPQLHLPLAVLVGALHVRDLRYVPYGDSGTFALDTAAVAGDFHGDQLRITSLHARTALFDLDLHGHVRPRREYPLDLELSGSLRLAGQPEVRGRAHLTGSLERTRANLRLEAPCVASVEAKLEQLLGTPRFEAELKFADLDPHTLAAAAPSLRLSGRLAADGTPERFRVGGQVSALSDSLGALDASVAVARAGDSLLVSELVLTSPGKAERIRVRGALAGLSGTPSADVVADWQQLVWPLRGDTLVRSEQGELHLSGTPAHYTLRFDGGLETAHGDLGRWQLEATGDTTQLEVSRLAGRMFAGSVLGRGTLAWRPRLSWRATLHADSLDPGQYWPEWPGRVAVELESDGHMRDSIPVFAARISRLEGTLKHLPLSGHGSVSADGAAWGARDLRLAWGAARLTADGTSGDAYDVNASLVAPDLRPFLAGASGALRAEVKLMGQRGAPHLELVAHGDSLAWGEYSARMLALNLRAGLNDGDSLRLALDARRAMLLGHPIDTLTLRGAGNTHQHTLSGGARVEGDTLALAASGSLAHEHWRGNLERFDVRTRGAGVWRLEAPVAIAAGAGSARLEHFCLKSGAHSVCGLADWAAGGALHAQAALTALPIGLLDPLLPAGARVVGTLDGTIDANAERPEGPLNARVRLTQSAADILYAITSDQPDTVHVGESKLTLDSDAHGARGALSVRWASGDQVEVQVSLPGCNVLRPDSLGQPVEGSIRSHASDLTVIGAYVPGLDQTRGDLSADLRLSGRLPRPDVDGEIRLKDGHASIPALGVSLKDITLALHCEPGRRMRLEGSLASGTGSAAITGAAELDKVGSPAVTFGLKGKDLTLADTREATVRVSPDLQVSLQHGRVDVSGQLDIPFARLVSVAKTKQLPVPPSADVVLVGRDVDSTAAGPKLYSRVRIVIGDDVEVRVPQFRGKPEGSILAIDEPGQPTRATGELKVVDGTYRAYGQDLKIERGRLIFGGGAISNPGLDLRASRTATDETVAGVQITGTAEAPVLDLFSSPAMSQNDALSYIMFGKPMSETGGSGGAAALAGSQLSVQGTDILARGVAGKLGIQDASVESKEGSLQDASLFLGAYLSPKLYVSYGIGLFEAGTTIRMRYKMTKHWSVETETGNEHSGQLQYSAEH